MNLSVVPYNAFLKPNANKILAFRGETASANSLQIPDQYRSEESKNRTVTIMGCSGPPCREGKEADSVKDTITKTYSIAQELVKRGYNVLTGCGDKGIMGAGYKGALSAEKDPENPKKNLAVLVEPLWGDEDTKHCKVIGKSAKSEADRIENGFSKASNKFLVFPGGVCSIQEATTLIAGNNYIKKDAIPKEIFLVGKDFYRGLTQQYDDLYKAGTLKKDPKTLFKVIEPQDVLKEFPDLKQPEKKFEATA